MKFKKLASILTAVVCALSITACSANKTEEKKPAETAKAPEIIVNKEKKEVIYPAEVNGKYFTEGTRHGVVFKDGSNGEKAVLRGLADQVKFHEALTQIGAKPGNNLTLADMKKSVPVAGDKLNVFVTWEGANKEIPFADVIKASEEKPMDVRFGGNLENAKKKKTGCVLCLDSCAVGITSDAAYPTGAVESKKVTFTGDKNVLPADGTKVSVIFRLAK
ncbi:YdjY domain-containing protein [Clostridium cylindrosporum]|uniref:4Fe-4S ferredoxin-type domain-containing protein n=1 Tax=Clostridium cylindrosporum DSM 605 TaxID=1121307 RepID=A0A0J8D9K8_CLOCY|nr:YdjY domain-containing protein [Clostridium cylindrosporum]KMT22512.1 hypothetical protein CLCY_10c00570 [Clostridium cylindrosporum DSM 605]